MSISALIAEGLAELYQQGHLSGARSILEFGPQNIGVHEDHRYYIKVARRVGGVDAAKRFENAAYNGDNFDVNAHKEFYKIFGLEDYASVDLLDASATYNHNLNEPFILDQTYDVVTDFGTAEHIFNIGQNFVNAHNALKVGGLWLAQLPTLGGYYHGFYNIHNIWYRSIAAANGYEIVQLLYSADNTSSAINCEREGRLAKVQDIRISEPRRMMLSFYLADFWSTLTRGDRASAVILAALRKTRDKPFIWPQQINKYG